MIRMDRRGRRESVVIVRVVVVVVVALGLLVVALPAGVEAAAAKPAATEIGVSASEIRIAVVADVDNAAEPGLHRGNVDAIRSFATDVNAHGGLAGRRLVVDFY